MSDTPETDEKMFESDHGHEHVFADFAHTLERQRDEARAEAKRLREALNDIIGTLEAHEVDTLDCDRAGRKFCTCLERRIEKAQKALAVPTVTSSDPSRRIMTAQSKEWWVHDGRGCPCDPEMIVEALLHYERNDSNYWPHRAEAKYWDWVHEWPMSRIDIVAWRPANAPDKLQQEGNEV